jgi:hypothetical protein
MNTMPAVTGFGRVIRRSSMVLPILVVAGGLWAACGVRDRAQEGVAYLVGMQEYVFGFPLVMMDVTREVMTATATSGEYKAPINQFARLRAYVDPDFKDVVRISVNSLWSQGFVDLDAEPMVVSVPDMKGRYVVVQALNMWTDVFGSAGTRTNGGKAARYLIAGPKWKGTAPQDVTETFRSSTRYAWILVQMSANSPADYPDIHALQDQLSITPLGAWGRPYAPPQTVAVDSHADLTATPFDQVRLMTGATFFSRLAKALTDNPPYADDSTMIERLKRLGVEPGRQFDPTKIDPDILTGINKAPWEVWKQFAIGPYDMIAPNGWVNMLNLGRYGTDYNTRAFVAYMGLGALPREDAVYPSAFVDASGTALDGGTKYVMHFEKDALPPSKVGVWSISPYRDNFYVRNALNRYGILSSMPLKFNADGSLDVYIQATSPGADKESNWLPCPPSGSFNLTIRAYQPMESLLNGTYVLPPVRRVS